MRGGGSDEMTIGKEDISISFVLHCSHLEKLTLNVIDELSYSHTLPKTQDDIWKWLNGC